MIFRHLIVVIVIVAVCHVVYWNALNTPFQFDDLYQIAGNIAIRNAADPINIWQFSPKRFVLMYTYAINYALGGENTWGYHYANLLIHAANAALLFFLGRFVIERLSRRPPGREGAGGRATAAAFIGALFFSAHPMLSEGVTYVSGRSSSLCAMFGLITLLLYMHARVTPRAGRAAAFVALGVLSCLMAMMTKELAAAIPLLVLLVEYFCFFRRAKDETSDAPPRRAGYCLAPFAALLILAALYVAYRLAIHGRMTENEGYISVPYALTQFRATALYIGVLVFPANLSIDYALPMEGALSAGLVSCMALVAGILAAGLLLMRRRGAAGLASFAILWMFLSLLPSSNILFLRDAMADRRMYLPSAGLMLLLGWAAAAALERASAAGLKRVISHSAVLALLCAFGFMTAQRNTLYADRLKLWLDVRDKSPSSRAAHSCGLGWLEHAMESLNAGRTHMINAELWNARLALCDAGRLSPEEYEPYLGISDVDTLGEDFTAALREARLARLFAEERKEYTLRVYSRVVRGYFFRGAELLQEAKSLEAKAETLKGRGYVREAGELGEESESAYQAGRDRLLEGIDIYEQTLGLIPPRRRTSGEYWIATEYYYAAHRALAFYYGGKAGFNPERQRYHAKKWLDYGAGRAGEMDAAHRLLFQWMDRIIKGSK